MRGKILSVVILLVVTACDSEVRSVDESNFAIKFGTLPVGFNRQAGYVTFGGTGDPSFEPIATTLPVLHFAGANVGDSLIAYTSLAKHERGAKEWSDVSLSAAMEIELSDLVPTGRLIVEDAAGNATTISRDGSFIVAASWHPRRPEVLGYSYAEGDHYGISIYDLKAKSSIDVFQGDLTPEQFSWSDSGSYIGAYIADSFLPRKVVPPASEGTYDIVHRWQYVLVPSLGADNPMFNEANPGREYMRFSNVGPETDLTFESGAGHLFLPDGPIGGRAVLKYQGPNGLLTSEIRTDQIRFASKDGFAFVNFDGNRANLFASNGRKLPAAISALSTVTYYIPMHWQEASNITQVGSAYDGGCLVKNHNTAQLQYAVDIQIPVANYDEVIAAANGTTAGGASWVTCNALDTSNCSIYSQMCSSNGGWGNYVLLAHSDGLYTLYAHLESTNYQIRQSGRPASAGCWLADEGGTGNTSGNKNGCGDHVHFQWQNSIALSANSVSGAFVETTLGTGSCGSHATMLSGMSCVY